MGFIHRGSPRVLNKYLCRIPRQLVAGSLNFRQVSQTSGNITTRKRYEIKVSCKKLFLHYYSRQTQDTKINESDL